jgi:hypothetical protein
MVISIYFLLNNFLRKYSTTPIVKTKIPINHKINEPIRVTIRLLKIKKIIRAALAIIFIVMAPSIPNPLIPFSLYWRSINKAIQ